MLMFLLLQFILQKADEKLRKKKAELAECGKQMDAEKKRTQELETQMRHLQLLLINDRDTQVSGLTNKMEGGNGGSGKVPTAFAPKQMKCKLVGYLEIRSVVVEAQVSCLEPLFQDKGREIEMSFSCGGSEKASAPRQGQGDTG